MNLMNTDIYELHKEKSIQSIIEWNIDMKTCFGYFEYMKFLRMMDLFSDILEGH